MKVEVVEKTVKTYKYAGFNFDHADRMRMHMLSKEIFSILEKHNLASSAKFVDDSTVLSLALGAISSNRHYLRDLITVLSEIDKTYDL